MLKNAEPDLLLAIRLLGALRQSSEVNQLWTALTCEYITLSDAHEMVIAMHRLRQNLPQYPLRHITLFLSYATPQFISALAATTTLESMKLVTGNARAVMLQLMSVPSVRAVDSAEASRNATLELLLTRTNWRRIELPTELASATTASHALATLNRTDFELWLYDSLDPKDLKLWLSNPHLTSLRDRDHNGLEGCFDALSQCQSLTNLVRSSNVRLPTYWKRRLVLH
jgi:hypothetical protein